MTTQSNNQPRHNPKTARRGKSWAGRLRSGGKSGFDAGEKLNAKTELAPASVRLRITGEFEERRHRVYMNDEHVLMTPSEFETVVRLVVGRITSEMGYVRIDSLAVHRTRKRLATVDLGSEVIETVRWQHYRLSPCVEVEVDRSFAEMPAAAISKNEVELLKARFLP